ncbi:glyoxylate/hydroxypyruvate reductase A [Caballeronia sp. LZ001]|uniref:2-hydroxyacid dehydrogenase n=1 Tax=Caballeronia sp. LZ001 TaxID=3038553 RepID=UPI0028597C75|nr:glyoxylate/hydroxypyruvate reductase A [Caballeronia sp. LZ001]MDR5804772.1 glyoxylate/hydroxypyruvate reductase A [Caballeronia sp. LZ001]
MTLLVNFCDNEGLQEWQALFEEHLPGLPVRHWEDTSVNPDDVLYVLLWKPEAGRTAKYKNLRLVLSQAAGVDHLLADQNLPGYLPIVRMVTAETSERMADYVTMAAYALTRNLPRIVTAQREKRWDTSLIGGLASETTVGIMGLGNLGVASCNRLIANGFAVRGWSRTLKQIRDVACFAGASEFAEFLAGTNVLVNLLPETTETRGLLSSKVLNMLPRGAGVVNVGRGSQLDIAALTTAIDSGTLGGAILDVFDEEPLPSGDAIWEHPGVIVTGHLASIISRRSKAKQAAMAIRAEQSGERIPHLFDRIRGY